MKGRGNGKILIGTPWSIIGSVPRVVVDGPGGLTDGRPIVSKLTFRNYLCGMIVQTVAPVRIGTEGDHVAGAVHSRIEEGDARQQAARGLTFAGVSGLDFAQSTATVAVKTVSVIANLIFPIGPELDLGPAVSTRRKIALVGASTTHRTSTGCVAGFAAIQPAISALGLGRAGLARYPTVVSPFQNAARRTTVARLGVAVVTLLAGLQLAVARCGAHRLPSCANVRSCLAVVALSWLRTTCTQERAHPQRNAESKRTPPPIDPLRPASHPRGRYPV